MILDACRDNPFSRSFRSGAKGLMRMGVPAGTFIAYSTSPDAVAYDGDGRNGVLTRHLLSAIGGLALLIEQVMKEVRLGVMEETLNKQVPWDASSPICCVFGRQHTH